MCFGEHYMLTKNHLQREVKVATLVLLNAALALSSLLHLNFWQRSFCTAGFKSHGSLGIKLRDSVFEGHKITKLQKRRCLFSQNCVKVLLYKSPFVRISVPEFSERLKLL